MSRIDFGIDQNSKFKTHFRVGVHGFALYMKVDVLTSIVYSVVSALYYNKH